MFVKTNISWPDIKKVTSKCRPIVIALTSQKHIHINGLKFIHTLGWSQDLTLDWIFTGMTYTSMKKHLAEIFDIWFLLHVAQEDLFNMKFIVQLHVFLDFCSCSRELLNCFRGLRDWGFQSPSMARCTWGQLIFLHIRVSYNKTDFHNITELLLKVAFNSYKFLINNFYVIPVKRHTECTQDPTFIQKIYEQTHVPYNSIIPHIFLDMKVRVW